MVTQRGGMGKRRTRAVHLCGTAVRYACAARRCGTPVRHGSAVRLSGTAVRHTRGTPVPYTRDSQRHTRAVLGRVAAGYEWAPRVPLRGGAVQGPVGGPVGGRVKGRVGGRSGRL